MRDLRRSLVVLVAIGHWAGRSLAHWLAYFRSFGAGDLLEPMR